MFSATSDRLERDRVELPGLELLRQGIGGHVAVAARAMAAAAAHRAARLSGEAVDLFGHEHTALLEDRALLVGERGGDDRQVPGVGLLLARDELGDLLADPHRA